jgi:hypothetical protein
VRPRFPKENANSVTAERKAPASALRSAQGEKAPATKAVCDRRDLVDDGGDEDEVDALHFDLRQDFRKGVQRGGMGMADGDGLAFFLCAANCELELFANFRGVLHIV